MGPVKTLTFTFYLTHINLQQYAAITAPKRTRITAKKNISPQIGLPNTCVLLDREQLPAIDLMAIIVLLRFLFNPPPQKKHKQRKKSRSELNHGFEELLRPQYVFVKFFKKLKDITIKTSSVQIMAQI